MDSLIALERPAPSIVLPDLDGTVHRSQDQRGRLTVVNFWSAECPWSERTDPVVLQATREADADLWTIASCWGETPDQIRRIARQRHLPLVLVDPDQAVADRYRAQATPHVFVIDEAGGLRYRGAPDDRGFGSKMATRSYLADALHALREGRAPDPAETLARGCAITRDPSARGPI